MNNNHTLTFQEALFSALLYLPLLLMMLYCLPYQMFNYIWSALPLLIMLTFLTLKCFSSWNTDILLLFSLYCYR